MFKKASVRNIIHQGGIKFIGIEVFTLESRRLLNEDDTDTS